MKSVNLDTIEKYLKEEFKYSLYQDSSLNGLQVESNATVTKIGAAVDFADSVLEKAASEGVDLLLTHHGLLWGQTATITGVFGNKIKKLIEKKINLFGIHLPLDGHSTFGNNIIIAKELLGLTNVEPAIKVGNMTIGWKGNNTSKLSLLEMKEKFLKITGALENPLTLEFGPKTPKNVLVVSGSAADSLYEFQSEKFDTLITGESKQFAYHFCKENNLNAIFAGHYATETFGVTAVAKHLADKFNLEWTFIDEPTGI